MEEKSYYFLFPDPGFVAVNGTNRVDFIQRQTTNDLSSIQAGQLITTVLTNPQARILDVLSVFEYKQQLVFLPLPMRHHPTTTFLKAKIFFKDDVQLIDLSEEYLHIEISGPRSIDYIHQITNTPPKDDEVKFINHHSNELILFKPLLKIFENSFSLVIPNTYMVDMINELEASGFVHINESEREHFRIKAGVPGYKTELTESYTPLETKLNWTVSKTKGCYVGQEVLARQINYDKISKRMVSIQAEGNISPGDKIILNSKSIGVITSCSRVSDEEYIAIGIMKTRISENLETLHIRTALSEVPAIIL